MFNNKMVIISILAVFMLVAISCSSVIKSNTINSDDKKSSPLFRIRVSRATTGKIGNILDNIRLFNERIFSIPFVLKYFLNSEDDYEMRWTGDPKLTCAGIKC